MLPRLDWIGLDIKAPFPRYAAITGRRNSGARAQAALDRVLASGVAYELRTTIHPDLLNAADLLHIATDLKSRGIRRWTLQRFRATRCADSALLSPTDHVALDAALPALRYAVPNIVVR